MNFTLAYLGSPFSLRLHTLSTDWAWGCSALFPILAPPLQQLSASLKLGSSQHQPSGGF